MPEKRLRELGQEQLARTLSDSSSPASREQILKDLALIDHELVRGLMRGEHLYLRPQGIIEPADAVPASFAGTDEAARAVRCGEDLLRSGRVAALIVAGGQGSRLGIDAPKGVVGVTPVKGKSLFQVFAEKILAVARRYGRPVPLFMMTSRENDGQTRRYLEENRWFGLDPNDVFLFVQGMLPSVTDDGRFIIAENRGLFMNPDGHGGVFAALKRNGCLNAMKARGIEEIFTFQVDNPLTKVCDPLFIGLHAMHQAEMSSKVVRKASFDEKVGVIVKLSGRTTLLEYSDMADEVRYAKAHDGTMLHWAGNMAVHMIRRDFAERITAHGVFLPFHRARKKISGLGPDGSAQEVDGIKFESFIFDALPQAERSITLEVERAVEFAPVKNLTGVDSLESARQLQSGLHASWLRRLGIDVKNGVSVEISPLFALDFEDLKNHADLIPPAIEQDTYLG